MYASFALALVPFERLLARLSRAADDRWLALMALDSRDSERPNRRRSSHRRQRIRIACVTHAVHRLLVAAISQRSQRFVTPLAVINKDNT